VRHGCIIVSRDDKEVTQLKGLQTQSIKERLGGLLVLAPLSENQALWITPCNSVHTFGMKYALDLVYIDKNNTVRGLFHNVKPWRMSFCLQAKSVMELTAGSLQYLDIQQGDSCKWQD
tara:strand:- start:1125 stop:1478 length:354 start_codon:yes stop_codon:yes gene_type:complete